MRRFFLENLKENKKLVEISGDQFLHMSKVLRMRVGDKFVGICGDKKEYVCGIVEMKEDVAFAEIEKINPSTTDAKTNVTVFQACVKGDKFDLIIQKLSELGISQIVPFDSDFCVAKCQVAKLDRYNKIATEACKQCKRTVPLKVLPPKTFKQVLADIENFDLVLFCNEHEDALTLKQALSDEFCGDVAIIVGSEGGFSPKEIEAICGTKAKSITLGKRILRAETASIAISACVMLLLGELE